MFFNQEQLTARILDVVALDQKNSDSFNRRGYHALSFRLEADTLSLIHISASGPRSSGRLRGPLRQEPAERRQARAPPRGLPAQDLSLIHIFTSNSDFMQAGFSLQSELRRLMGICSASRLCFPLLIAIVLRCV